MFIPGEHEWKVENCGPGQRRICQCIATVIERRRQSMFNITSEDTHAKTFQILGCHRALVVMAAELALDNPKEDLDWVVEWAIRREDYWHHSSHTNVHGE